MYNWLTKIQFVKGIGPVKAKILNGLGIKTVGDLLEHRPADYIYPGVTAIADLAPGTYALIQGTVEKIYRKPTQAPIVSAVIRDDTGTTEAIWFNQIWLLQSIRKGMTIAVWGKVGFGRETSYQFSGPKFSTYLGAVKDVVGGLYGVHTTVIREALKEVLADVEIPDWLNGNTVADWWTRHEAFEGLHFPEDKDVYNASIDRLKFDELLVQQLAVAVKRKQQKKDVVAPIQWTLGRSEKIHSYFPYQFTKGQNDAVLDINYNLQSGKPMSRLLQGDVGCGKTAVAFYVAMLTALNGKRAIILCPTTILAAQHFDTLREMGWEDVELCVAGSWINEDKIPSILIGTTAILQNVELLKRTSLVIVDEQHKFGVSQRALLQKYRNPHLLLMSATPIPRTLAMTVFGDLDVSTIREFPIKRGTIVTRWVLPDRREGMYEIIEQELAKGHQAYVVYPRIKSGDEDIISAEKGAMLIKYLFQNLDSALLTGKNSSEYKTSVLRQFRDNKIKILVSTIIAEVGLDNPNATVMVVEGADRFGLSQLHQLRGRICRSTETAFCFLVASTANETSIRRLQVMERCNDGFEIAEHDLRLRGPGEMFSTRQHGLPDLKFASLVDDYDLLVEARDLAASIVDKLDNPGYAGLKTMLGIKFPKFDLIGVG